MRSDRSEAASRLRLQLAPVRGPWIGFESDLADMGVSSLDDLRGRSADALLQDYCRRGQRPIDHALRPCFEAIVRYAETGQYYPWWKIMRDDVVRERDRLTGMASA